MIEKGINNEKRFSGISFKNKLVAASSPLTESVHRLECCEKSGFGAAILKSCADYKYLGTGYPRKIINLKDGFYADGSFESEIHTMEKGIALFENAKKKCKSMILIPSVTAMSLGVQPWIDICNEFYDRGAHLIQLDLFYLGTIAQEEYFYEKLGYLLQQLANEKYVVMPKLNVNLNAEKVCYIFKENKIRIVSLLDSIRKTAPKQYNLHPEGTSFFGRWQLDKTIEYLRSARKYGLEVCAGGGITNQEDINTIFEEGATLVQIASVILSKGFPMVAEFTGVNFEQSMKKELDEQKTWCDYSVTGICIGCGGCFFNE